MMNRVRLPLVVRWLGVLFSIGLHASIVLWLIWHWQPTIRYHIPGEAPVIQAALVGHLPAEGGNAEAISKATQSAGIAVHAQALQSEASSPHQTAKPIHLDGDQKKALVMQVYRAIAQHQHYPLMAKRLHHQGVVMLRFELLPSGRIRNVQVASTSHYQELDQAAHQAVLAASPIPKIHTLLDHSASMQIPIRFE